MNNAKTWTILDEGIHSSCSQIPVLKELSTWILMLTPFRYICKTQKEMIQKEN